MIFRRKVVHQPIFRQPFDMQMYVGADKPEAYVSCIFDCYDLMPLGLAIDNNMRLLSGRCGNENGYFYEYDRIYSTFILTRASIQV